ncbi:unnamed protein product [Rhizophagus irregularis]|nr:unnamed protein product [Rhizophagus irregularis]
MQKCWHPDPNERPTANDLFKIFAFKGNLYYWKEKTNPTKILESPDIGPITTSNPGAIYKSRPLSSMVRSAESTRSLRSQNIHNILFIDKRKLNCVLFRKDESIKRIKLFEIENDDYLSKELELDIGDNNINFGKSDNNVYITKEINFDI